jgi:hypothetical protein
VPALRSDKEQFSTLMRGPRGSNPRLQPVLKVQSRKILHAFATQLALEAG